jgi:hypothetical protein
MTKVLIYRLKDGLCLIKKPANEKQVFEQNKKKV